MRVNQPSGLIRHLQVLRAVTEAVSRSLDLNEVLQKSLAALTHVTGHEIASLHLISPDGQSLLLRGDRGLSDELRRVNLELPMGEGLIGRVALSGRGRRVDDAGREADLLPTAQMAVSKDGIRGFVCVPIRARHRILGTLSLGRQTEDTFTDEEMALLECVADQIGLALDNARLYGEIHRQLDDLRRAQNEVVKAERLSAVNGLAAGVAHEINNPLTIIMAQLRLEADGITVRTELEPVPDIWADHNHLQEVLLHLVQNAQHAMKAAHDGGVLSIRVRPMPTGVRIEVADAGPGIPPEHLPRIFNPFFTTKQPGDGRGLGLSVSHSIVDEHGGRLWAENLPDGGAQFTIDLPIGEPEPAIELLRSKSSR